MLGLFAQTKSKRYKTVLNYITTNSSSYYHEYDIHGPTYDSPTKMNSLSLILLNNADNLKSITLQSYLSVNFYQIFMFFKIYCFVVENKLIRKYVFEKQIINRLALLM